MTLHDYFGLHDYFNFENRQPYTFIPCYTVIRKCRVIILIATGSPTSNCIFQDILWMYYWYFHMNKVWNLYYLSLKQNYYKKHDAAGLHLIPMQWRENYIWTKNSNWIFPPLGWDEGRRQRVSYNIFAFKRQIYIPSRIGPKVIFDLANFVMYNILYSHWLGGQGLQAFAFHVALANSSKGCFWGDLSESLWQWLSCSMDITSTIKGCCDWLKALSKASVLRASIYCLEEKKTREITRLSILLRKPFVLPPYSFISEKLQFSKFFLV